jgi:hypothetical protein
MKAQVVKAVSGYRSAAQRLFGTRRPPRPGTSPDKDAFARRLRDLEVQNRGELLRKLKTRYARS